MSKHRRLVVFGSVLALAASGAALGAPTASADERVCRGSIGAKTLDNVRVPSGATCRLTGTKVKGTITVKRGARLFAKNVRVIGNVQGENAKNVVVRQRSRVGGSVQVKQGRKASILNSRINADIQYDAMRGYLRANGNKVGGNVQVVGNSGGAEIFRNRIDGNLQCKENKPRPTGGKNVVQGSKEDQCRRF
jgi:hypothetical protein